MVDSWGVSGSICPWRSVASCFNGVECAAQWFPKKSLTPATASSLEGRVVARRTLHVGRFRALGFALQIPLRPLSTRYFYPLTREQQCNVRWGAALHNFTTLRRGRPPLPHTRVTIHYVCVSYIRYVSPYISLGARIHLWPSSCPRWTPRLTFTLIIRVTRYCQHNDDQYNWGILRVTHC